MNTLRPFQQEDLDILTQNNYRALIANAPGTGKTILCLSCITRHPERLLPTVIVCPASVVRNWRKEARKWAAGTKVYLIEDTTTPLPKRPYDIYILSWSLLPLRWVELAQRNPQLIIGDECFPARTLVATPHGQVRIEQVVPGTLVYCRDESGCLTVRPTRRLIAKTLRKDLVRITHEFGVLTCTSNHEIWTYEDGYVRAENLTPYHHLCILSGALPPEKRVSDGSEADLLHSQMLSQGQLRSTELPSLLSSLPHHFYSPAFIAEEILRDFVFSKVAHESPGRSGSGEEGSSGRGESREGQGLEAPERGRTDASKQSGAPSRRHRQNTCEDARPYIPYPRGEREADSAATVLGHSTRPPDGVCHQNGAGQEPVRLTPALLQGGHSLSCDSFGDRGGRAVACPQEVEVFGQEEGVRLSRARVVSVEIHKSAGGRGSDHGSGEDQVVYDLEVDEHHNFFADGVAVHNCHFAKNEAALRTQALASLAVRAPHLLLLSGTPIINDTEELDSINGLFGAKPPVMIRRLLEDVAKDIPHKTRARVNVELPPKVATRYRSAAEDFAAWLEKEMATRMSQGEAGDAAARALAAEALVKIGYLRRILAIGKVYAAADFTARLVRAGEPVVLFAEHKAVMLRLRKCLHKQRIPYVMIDGSTSAKARHQAVEDFQKNKIPVFLGSKAAKEGLTLTAARHLIFVERYWTSAEEEQGEDRIRRIGQIHPTKIWFLHVPQTVDDRISAIIDRKRRIVRQAIGSENIADTPETTVASMLSEWSTHAGAPMMDTTELGITDPLPPLPRDRDVYVIRFKEARWQPESALRWCKMMGYRPTRSTPTLGGFEFHVRPATDFVPGDFTLFRVAQDIAIYVGRRVSPR